MSDEITCRCVLKKSAGMFGCDNLFLVAAPDFQLRILPCHPKGEARRGERPEWEYEERDGRLHLTPSLHATDTGFHTAFNWSCEYELCPAGIGQYDHFYKINPTIKK